MMNLAKAKPYAIAAGLILLMTLTRANHASGLLPDASLAVFFLAGIYCRRALFPLLLVVAAAGDYLAISSGTSNWCMSPAYCFLIPAYASLWLGGRWTMEHGGLRNALFAIGMLAMSATMAFVISSYGFYFFSGRYADASLLQYSGRIAQYYQPYVGSACLYVAAVMLMQILLAREFPRGTARA